MREIEFRGKSNGKWVYGYYVCIGDHHLIRIVEGEGSYCVKFFNSVDSKTVGQYTGLRDCNGQKIYEGDIVQTFDDYGSPHYEPVVYVEGCFIPLVSVEDGYNAIDRYYPDDFEVVGNVHDDPDFWK